MQLPPRGGTQGASALVASLPEGRYYVRALDGGSGGALAVRFGEAAGASSDCQAAIAAPLAIDGAAVGSLSITPPPAPLFVSVDFPADTTVRLDANVAAFFCRQCPGLGSGCVAFGGGGAWGDPGEVQVAGRYVVSLPGAIGGAAAPYARIDVVAVP